MMGTQLITHCRAKGYDVRAFGRNVESLIDEDLRDDHFTAVKGSVFNEKEILKGITGADAVITALGGASDGVDKTRSLGMKNIVSQMHKAGVKRIIGIGGLGILDADDDTMLMDTPDFPQQYVVVSQEHYKAFEYLLNSGLDWTLVCPPTIENKEANGHFKTKANHPAGEKNVSSGNLATFMVNELTLNTFLNQRVGISDI